MSPIVRLRLPIVAFRLSHLQRKAIRPALVRILISCQRELEGLSPSPHVAITFPPPRHGMFWPLFGELVSQLWVRSYDFFKKSGRCRFTADFLEISVLSLAARASNRFVSSNAADRHSARWRVSRTRLLRQLQQMRRRAARLAKKELGKDSYCELMKRWILFARWVKFWALTERYTNPVQKFVLARRRRIVNAAVRIAKEELISRRMDLPTDLDLRRLARRAIHEVRRHRRGFGIRTLLDEPFGHQFLVEFIIKRLKLAPTSSRQVARQLSQEVNR